MKEIDLKVDTSVFDLSPDEKFIIFPVVDYNKNTCTVNSLEVSTEKSQKLLILKSETLNLPQITSLHYSKDGKGFFYQLDESTHFFDFDTKTSKEIDNHKDLYDKLGILINFHKHKNIMTPDKNFYMYYSNEGIKVWDCENNKLKSTLPFKEGIKYNHFGLSHDAELIAVYVEDSIEIYNTNSSELKHSWKIENSQYKQIELIEFSPDNNLLLITVSPAAGPIILKIENGEEIYKFLHPSRTDRLQVCFSMLFSHDKKNLFIGSYVSAIDEVNFETKEVTNTIMGVNMRTYKMILSNDGKKIYSGGDSGVINISELE